MEKNKRNLFILGGVMLIAVGVWMRGLTAPVKTGKAPGNPLPPSQSSLSSPAIRRETPARRARTEFSEWGRNPFLLEGELAQGVRGLVLNGIVWDESTPLAIINDQVLGVGSQIRNSKIIKITQMEVFLKEGDDEFILRLGQKAP